MKNRIGYCCIALGINEGLKPKDHIKVNRGMVKKTFESKGLSYVSELIIDNLKDTIKILDYNIKNEIFIYRLSSDSFPWMSEYEFEDLPNFNKIESLLISIGNKIKENDLRCGYHPGPFNVLGSENPSVVEKTIKELDKHAQLLDMMGLDKTNYYSINIHLNTTQPSREEAAERFCKSFERLSESCKKRLTIENDDKLSQYSVKMLHDLVYQKIGIPIIFDQLHFKLGPQDQTMEEALKLALSTWKVKPLTHMASSIHNENPKGLERAHADYIYEPIETFGMEFDCEIESKAKDLAVLKYREDYKMIQS
jgi:UV DNA damage endonuclease